MARLIKQIFNVCRYSNIYSGLIAYVFVTRGVGLNPFKVGWLLQANNGNLDAAQNYLGWEFYRNAPLFQWPLGAIPNLGPGGGSSVALTDSLPLLAIIFKPFTASFDAPFQYFGLWILICFLLQSYFAGKILHLWIDSRLIVFLASFLFTLAPAFIDRMRIHLPLSGHWLVLVGIFLFLKTEKRNVMWVLLGCVAVLVQPYFVLIVFMLYLVNLIQLVKTHITEYSSASIGLLIFIVANLFTGFQSGLFIFGFGQVSADGFGDFTASIFSLVDPVIELPFSNGWSWSSFEPAFTRSQYQYEGFSYLGTGALAITVIVLIVSGYQFRKKFLGKFIVLFFLANYIVARFFVTPLAAMLFSLIPLSTCLFVWPKTKQSRLGALLFACLILALLAISNRIEIGTNQFRLPIGGLAERFGQIYRSSGRLIWALMYFLILGAIITLTRTLRSKKMIIFLLFFAVLFQIQDSRSAMTVTRNRFSDSYRLETLSSPLWSDVSQRYDKISIITPNGAKLESTNSDFYWFPQPYIWLDLALFAIENDIALDDFYFSRNPVRSVARETAKEVVFSSKYESDSIYVFTDAPSWILAKINHRDEDLIGLLDGLPVLLPGLAECKTCDLTGFESKV